MLKRSPTFVATALAMAATALLPAAATAATNTITTVAGTGSPGNEGDGGPASQATFNQPVVVVATPDGGYLVTDYANNRVRRVSASGVVSAAAGGGASGAPSENVDARNAELLRPLGIALLPDGGFLLAESGTGRIRRVGPPNFPIIFTVAGGGQAQPVDGTQATSAQLGAPTGVATTSDGGFAFTDSSTQSVYKVGPAPNATLTRIAGGGVGPAGSDGPATSIELSGPGGIIANADGSYIFAETFGKRLRRISPSGDLSTIAGTGAFTGDLGDGGPAVAGQLAGPYFPSTAPDGGILVPDLAIDTTPTPAIATESRIRRVANGTISTIAGAGPVGASGDGGPALSARLNAATSVAFLADGDYLIADAFNNRIRRVDASEPPAAPPSTLPGPPAARPATRPLPKLAFSKLGLSPRSPKAKSAAKAKLTFTLNRAARVGVRLDQIVAGRKSGRKCAKPSRANRKKKSCKRSVKAGSRTISGRTGKNTVTLGSLKKRPKKGSYKVTISASGVKAKTLALTIKK